MGKLLGAGLLALALGGCASEPAPVYTATGAVGHKIDCSGQARNWNACFEQAGAICKTAGYSIISRTDERMPKREGSGGAIGAIHDFAGSRQVARSMVVQCNDQPLVQVELDRGQRFSQARTLLIEAKH